MTYTPPLSAMQFLLEHVTPVARAPGAGDLDMATVQAVLEEAGKLARDVLAPLNHPADKAGCILKDGAVTTPPGVKEAYARYRDGGWNAVPFPPEYGGQGLPWVLAFAVQEMWQAANMSFGLCPLLNQGAVEAIAQHGSQQQKDLYLEKLVSGEWTGTMNLTEPQAGSDLAAIRTRAERNPDGTYRVFGQKIFITYGEHDFAENIIHLVLARLPDGPDGVKGISLFTVPKFLPDGTRNDVICTGIEHKLGIHASPTCTMQYGDNGGAQAMLVGEEHQGIKYMFTMMNNARLSVGLQGVAIADRACQKAVAYAQERVQGKVIIAHADVARMITYMQVMTETARALAYDAALHMDRAHGGDPAAQARVEVMTPVVKAWCTDMAVEVASIGVQVHGGMGFIEETGAAQFYRDARILPIYEGTNGIQANDLVFRKVLRDGGAALGAWLDEMAALDARGTDFHETLAAFRMVTADVLADGAAGRSDAVGAVAVPYLRALAVIACMAMALRMAAMGEAGGDGRLAFYAAHILPRAGADIATVTRGRSALTC